MGIITGSIVLKRAGNNGQDGKDGQDGYTVTLDNSPLTLVTDDEGVPESVLSGGVQVYGQTGIVVRKGTATVDGGLVAVTGAVGKNCAAKYNETTKKVQLRTIASYTVKDYNNDGRMDTMYYTDGWVDIDVKVSGVSGVFTVRWTWHLDYTRYFGQLTANDHEFKSQIGTISNAQGELEEQMTTIEQTAKKISLTVSSLRTPRRNLVKGSYLGAVFKTYGVCRRTVWLDKGKTYTLSMCGRLSEELLAEGGNMQVHLEYQTAAGAYDGTAAVTPLLEKNTEEQTVSVTFTPKEKSGRATLAVYPKKVASDGTVSAYTGANVAVCEWVQLEEGGTATPWTLAEGEGETCANLLPKLGNMVVYVGATTEKSGLTLESGVKSDVVHAKNTGTANIDVCKSDGLFSPSSGESYTLSFRAKGSGQMDSHFYPSCVQGQQGSSGVSKFGTSQSATGDGLQRITLSGEWRGYSVTWTTGSVSGAKNVILCRLLPGSEVWIGAAKLERNGRATEYGVREQLLDTGIDIEQGKVEVTADNFNIRNNDGDLTFTLDKDGKVTMRHVSLGGMLSKTAVEINGDGDAAECFVSDEFDSSSYPGVKCYLYPIVNNMYGIYRIKGSTTIPFGYAYSGQVRGALAMPSFDRDENGAYYYDGWDPKKTEAEMAEDIMAIRCLVGNTVMVYNESAKDVIVKGWSPTYKEIVDKIPLSSGNKAAARASSQGNAVTGDMGGVIIPSDQTTYPPQSGYVYAFKGLERQEMTVTLKGGANQFAVFQCVCEADKNGYECVHWILNRGWSFLPAYVAQ